MQHTVNIPEQYSAPSKVIVGSIDQHLPLLIDPSQRVIVITDVNAHIHNRALVDSYPHIIIGQGESSKTIQTVENICRQLLEMNADRSTLLLGIGGGIVTDITGFAASVFMRGMEFGFIPTTLLSQVDASVGGKNGVNMDGYKNIIGVFRQPRFVICDPATLNSLPEREFRAGLAEVIKAGIIADPDLFGLFEKHNFEEFRSNEALLSEIINRAISVKINIVQKDEREKGERRKLNLGHTFAHSLEKNSQAFSHGEAVALGTVLIADVAAQSGRLSGADAERIKNVFEKMGLPTQQPIEPKKLLSAIKYDKKRERDTIYVVFPTAIGNCETVNLTFDELENLFTKSNPDK